MQCWGLEAFLESETITTRFRGNRNMTRLGGYVMGLPKASCKGRQNIPKRAAGNGPTLGGPIDRRLLSRHSGSLKRSALQGWRSISAVSLDAERSDALLLLAEVPTHKRPPGRIEAQ
jgi:hypothetical protein